MEKDAKTTGNLLHRLVQEIISQQDFAHLRNRTERAVEFISTKLVCSSSTFYKMKEGKRGFPHDSLAALLNLAKDDAKLDREWGEAFLRSIGYLDHETITNNIWGHKQPKDVLENLPKPDHTLFVGRQEVLEKLLYWLSPKMTSPVISIDGIGGVGKRL